jgi:3-hydroxyacyl-CoA dehydrogenase
MALSINKVGVIGAGQMGSGIALVCAQVGMSVLINDVAEERVKAALATINGFLSRQVAKGQLDEAGRRSWQGSASPAATTNSPTAISSLKRRPRARTSSARFSPTCVRF